MNHDRGKCWNIPADRPDVAPGLLRLAAEELRYLAEQHRGYRYDRAMKAVHLIERQL